MVDKSTVCIGLAVDVIDRMQSALETFVHPYSVAFRLACPVVRHQRLVHLCLLVDIRQLVLLQRLTLALAFLFGTTHQRNSVSLSILFAYLVVRSGMRNSLFTRSNHALVRIFVDADRSVLSDLQRMAELVAGCIELAKTIAVDGFFSF